MLELEYPLNIDNYTRPVCLGTNETLLQAQSQSNPECYVTGFGQSEKFFNGNVWYFKKPFWRPVKQENVI